MDHIPSKNLHLLNWEEFQVLQRKVVFAKEIVRRMFIIAVSGHGKTQLMKFLVWADLRNEKPVFLFDQNGALIDAFLGEIIRQPTWLQEELWPRIRYIDLSGSSGYVNPIPFYYRMGDESWAEIATRPVDIWIKSDPDLIDAPIMGASAVKEAGDKLGMLLAAMGCQPSEAHHLLAYPEAWFERVRQAVDSYPELAPAVSYYHSLVENPNRQRAETLSFFRKVDDLILEPSLKAMFCASQPLLTVEKVINDRLCVLLDGRHLHRTQRRQFSFRFVLDYVHEYVKHRGAGRHDPPLSLFLDEIMSLFPMVGSAAEQLAVDLDALINFYARNYSLWLCVSTQEVFQVAKCGLDKTLLGMPTLLIGAQSDQESCEILAKRFYVYDDEWNRRYDPMWMNDPYRGPFVVDVTPVPFNVEEQLQIRSRVFRSLPPFEFFALLPTREGELAGRLEKVTIADLNPSLFHNPERVAEAREGLLKRDCRTVYDVHEEISARLPHGIKRLQGSSAHELTLDHLMRISDDEPMPAP